MISYTISRKLSVLVLLLCLLFLGYGFYFRNKTFPNVFLSDLKVSNNNMDSLAVVVARKIQNFESEPVVFIVNDGQNSEEIETTYENLGIKLDNVKSANLLYKQGRSENFFFNLAFRIRSLFVKTVVEPVYTLDASRFASTLDSLLAKHTKSAADATVVFEGSIKIAPEQAGRVYNRELLTETIRNRVGAFSILPVEVNFVDVQPQVKSTNATKALEKVKTLNNQRISLKHDRETWLLVGENLLSVLRFRPEASLGENLPSVFLNEPVVFSSVNLIGAFESDLDVTLDEDYLEKFVGDIATAVDVDTVDATLKFDGQKVSQFTPAKDGQKLDEGLTKKLILEKISVGNISGEGVIVINLPVALTKARIANEEINSMGIVELIGKGVSYFAGSIPNRVYNVTLGSSRVNGTIVKPGESFSFNRAVGEVSGASGYKPAYVISSGRTVLDDGGGICQVSTTVFRAALNAGLPIVARTAHAYRVGYYEQHGYKAGLDATVWAPAVDLVFKNDTNHSILVQAVVDPLNVRLEVDIYGTGDGRRVELSEPVISNVKPAPEAKYQDDPTLPKGTVKQVDFAAGGATSVFTRKVSKGTQVIIDDVFKSNYRPWQAVYLVGTGN